MTMSGTDAVAPQQHVVFIAHHTERFLDGGQVSSQVSTLTAANRTIDKPANQLSPRHALRSRELVQGSCLRLAEIDVRPLHTPYRTSHPISFTLPRPDVQLLRPKRLLSAAAPHGRTSRRVRSR